MDLKSCVREIPDFPQEGVLFRDITPLIADAEAFRELVDQMAGMLKDVDFDYIVAPEARGFIVGVPVALKAGAGFVPVRKPGKLPYETIRESYDLEYGSNTIEMHKDALKKGDKVVVMDDLLATGGTAEAVCRLCEKLGAQVQAVSFAIELTALGGRECLKKYPVYTLIRY